MIFSSLPVYYVDMLGSMTMIMLSFMCLVKVRGLKKQDPDNIIWTYLQWVCYALAVFAISRSAGHLLKQLLLFSGHRVAWDRIRPFSGAVNTFMFMVVASVTIFFERIWKVYQQILVDKQALQDAHEELLYLNQNLEKLVSKRTEALAFSEHKYRRIFEVSKDMILVTEADGRIVEINPVGYEMLGYQGANTSPVGHFLQNHFADQQDWRRLSRMLGREGSCASVEVDVKRKDGSRFKTLFSGSLDHDPAQNQEITHFVVKDIERRKSMEQQMAQADKLASIGQLAAGIAHEINNPLGIIQGYTQLLLRGEKSGGERHDDLKTIEKHVRSCKLIVEDLLNFARSSDPKKEVIYLHKVVDDVLSFIQHHCDLGRIEIVRDYIEDIPTVLLDEKKIKQVFINLIMNAIDAVGQDGTITLATDYDATNGQVFVRVADTGYGIQEKNLSRIFDPFFTTKPTGEATGLGLSVSYGIVKNHGGNISVQSKPGLGATFTVSLPASPKPLESM